MQTSHVPSGLGQPAPLTDRPPYSDFVVGKLGACDAPACEGFIRHLEQRDLRMRLGIPGSLLAHLLQGAGNAGLSRLTRYVLAENNEMLALAESVGCRRIKRDGLFVVTERAISLRSE